MGFWLQVIGLTLDIVGVLMMSYSYFSSSRWYHLPTKLIMALASIKRAELTVQIAQINGQKLGYAFRGLAYVLLGFIFQFLGLIAPVIKKEFF